MNTARIPARPRNPQLAAMGRDLILDVGLPLALYYGFRAFGMNQWLALVLSGALPLLRIILRWVSAHRLERAAAFTLTLTVCSTLVALLTGDPRLLLARESYFTAVIGLWMGVTAFTRIPFMLTTMLHLLPEATAATWRRNWVTSRRFRIILRAMSGAWGAVFLIDAAARIIMAYTLPVDAVPVASSLLLVGMLILVVLASRTLGRRLLARELATGQVAVTP